jgi:esterase/lipase superfamily enzyme
MQVEYHKWWSSRIGRDMEMKVYGHYGKPVLVFPAQGGRFYEYEDFQMVEAVRGFLDAGQIKLYTIDSLDNETWGNQSAHPADRARRHEDYDQYVVQEVMPFIRKHCNDEGIKALTTGCSMGAYHSANFFFRHPDCFDGCMALSGLYQLRMFVGDYMDDNVYFNAPLCYLPNMHDPWFLDQYRRSKIVIACGQGAWEDEMLADTLAMHGVLQEKGVPAWIDIWGLDVNHDWPWWRKMAPYFLSKIL